MENICLVIDLDGHRIQKEFYCRELGYAELSTPWKECGSYRFDLRPYEKLIREEDRPTIFYCEKVLGVLKFWPSRREREEGELFRLDDLEQLVRNLYNLFKRPGRNVVAYKGGHVESDLLKKMNIPHVNLEEYGCPKFQHLPENPEIKDCGYHKATRIGPSHCPKKECAAFAEWIREEQKKDLVAEEEEEEWWDV